MNFARRKLISMAGMMPGLAISDSVQAGAGGQAYQQAPAGSRMVLSNFEGDEPVVIDGAGWRGFSDRVMGGVSDGELNRDTIAGKNCIRLTGNVTTDSGGGFVQMALYLGERGRGFDASAYEGLELLVFGNDEDYNVHIRTADTGWHDESYRTTFKAGSEWQTVRLPWSAFEPNGLSKPLNTSSIQRIGLLGWMRKFEADLALGEIALYS